MHEPYQVPKGHWEAILLNTRPFGLSSTRHFVEDKETRVKKQVNPLVQAEGKAWDRMRDRMGAS